MVKTKYNDKHQKALDAHPQLKTVEAEFPDIKIGTTQIDVSGKIVDVEIWRGKHGNIEVIITNDGIFQEGGWLFEGTCTEGYESEVIITQFTP